jgi:hypothetical protein
VTSLSEREARTCQLLTNLTAGATAFSLYGHHHPRAQRATQNLLGDLIALFPFAGEKLTVVVIGSEVFVEGKPYSRLARQAHRLVHLFHRARLEYVTFLRGVSTAAIEELLITFATGERAELGAQPNLTVGRVAVDKPETAGGGPERGGSGGEPLPSLRNRVGLVRDALSAVAAGRAPDVESLEHVTWDLLNRLAENSHPPLEHDHAPPGLREAVGGHETGEPGPHHRAARCRRHPSGW